MSRIRIELPENFRFSTSIPVRITDVNYGGHVGNDAILSIIHEARMQFLAGHGYSELNFAGAGLIMSDVGIEFKSELFYGEMVRVSVAIGDPGRVGFGIYYKLEKTVAEKTVLVASARTGMICFDYTTRKIRPVPAELGSLI